MAIPEAMRALVLHAPGQPMVIETVPVPKCGDYDVLVKVQACGVCHTDEALAKQGFPETTYPHVLGHEGAGTVAQVGSAVEKWKVGDRVFVPMFAGSCGTCNLCLRDHPMLCPTRKAHTFNMWGCFAEYVLSNPSTIVAVPDNVSFEKAGPCGCAGATVVAAIRRAEVPKGGWVGFSGTGGLGLMGVQVAKAQGYKVLAIDIDDSKLAEATSLGADAVVNARTAGADLAAQVSAATGGGLDANIVVTSAIRAYEASLTCARPGSTIVFIGVVEGTVAVPPMAVMANELRIIGSVIGTVADAEKCISLVAEGKVTPVTSPCKLSDVEHVFDELEKGKVIGRKVVTDMMG